MIKINYNSVVLDNMVSALRAVKFNLSALEVRKHTKGYLDTKVSYNDMLEDLSQLNVNINEVLNHFWKFGICSVDEFIYEIL